MPTFRRSHRYWYVLPAVFIPSWRRDSVWMQMVSSLLTMDVCQWTNHTFLSTLCLVLFILAAAGDPLQLPVFRVTDTSAQKGAYSKRARDDSFFSTYGDVVELVIQHRQAWGDPLLSILSLLRVGDCREEDLALLNSVWADEADEWPDFQRLRANSSEAQAYNNKRLAELVVELVMFSFRGQSHRSCGVIGF